ncbi:cysteine desulfurase CsdA [Candidatus Roizmanbacteria bacterium CG_4_10_14_0_8_um_filter_33_9]|uniref:Cysteine desulfurase n=1 Tax=Candidatus Roizmanbacteria bacterium CG_4_10_14_0_8_um_filter_33_9 TaxID=1974826 RepID=A0A2M7QGT6_9BACT|nr:MAG: cysteine desulfurase CsdA [Candidatus Roizmanbacteria bacterium CG_4_10_14_0_8_um_filter_33_9]
MINVTKIKKDFPIFTFNPELIYLDSTATSLKPQLVIDKLNTYYQEYSANIYRGIYDISEKATEEFEKTREAVASFIHSYLSDEIIFTRNTTESINLIMYTLGDKIISKNDEIAVSIMEHHSNFVPWQVLAQRKSATLSIIDIDNNGQLVDISKTVTKKTKILSLTYISNVLGTINPIKKIIQQAKQINPEIIVIIDAAQAVPHIKVDVQDLNCDFLVFSSHKMLGPTGVGVLWGRKELLEHMNPFLYGGEMIETVSTKQTTYKTTPQKFEAGTPHIAGIIALREAIEYINAIGLKHIYLHEQTLVNYAIHFLEDSFKKKIQIFGPREMRSGIISFTLDKIHPHDIAQLLNDDHIAVRAGNHCAMPLHTRLHITASIRASFYLYNTTHDIDMLVKSLHKAIKIIG